MPYTEQLESWFQQQKAAGKVVDVKFFPGIDAEGSFEKLAKAAYEIVAGERDAKPLDLSEL